MRPAALIFCLGWAGCSSTTSRPLFDRPSLTPLTFEVSADPPGDPVVRDAVLRITFDDYPDPDAVAFGNLLLRSGTVNFDVDMRVDLVAKAVLMRPVRLLAPGAEYELVVGDRMAALSGRTVGTPQAVTISVGNELAPSPQPEPVHPSWSDRSCTSTEPDYDPNNIRCIIGTCSPYCHSTTGASGRTRNPTYRLDLTGDPQDPVYGIINVPSVGLEGTDRQLVRVSVGGDSAKGDSARSLLLRKLIGGDPTADSRDPPYPATKVPGRRMPIPLDESEPASDPLPDDQLQLLQRWIDDGAPVL